MAARPLDCAAEALGVASVRKPMIAAAASSVLCMSFAFPVCAPMDRLLAAPGTVRYRPSCEIAMK